MAIAIIAQSAAQTPMRPASRNNAGRWLTDCPDEWFVRGARWVMLGRYRGGLNSVNSIQTKTEREMTAPKSFRRALFVA